MKGSELLPPDSSRYELDVRNAILLYEYLIDNMNMQQVNKAMSIYRASKMLQRICGANR